MPQEEMSSICKPALRTAFLLTSAMSAVISSIVRPACVGILSCDNLVILIYYASDHIGTANVQTEIILGAFHLCSLFYEVNRVNYLLAKIEELPALDNVRFSLK